MGRASSTLRQAFPPAPEFTEANIGDLTGKVCIVTGSNTGVGKQVVRILYSKNATVYVAARSESKAQSAIDDIKQANPDSAGSLAFIHLDLGDLSTIKTSADKFLTSASRLDLLINNAGVMMPPEGSKTAQGYELQLGTNCLGHFLFTKFLTPILAKTAADKETPHDSVRVVWVSSSAADNFSPKDGVPMDNLDYHNRSWKINKAYTYGVSKSGNWYHNAEFARRMQKDGVVSVALNPGNLNSDLSRHVVYGNPILRMITSLLTYPPVNGAYTELFAALSPEITLAKSGCWVVPWGRFDDIRSDLAAGARPKEEGGTGIAQQFWNWSEEQVKPFL